MLPTINDLFDLSQCPNPDLFEDCENPWDALTKLTEYLAAMDRWKISCDITEAAYIDQNVSIGQGTIIEHGAVIYGPTVIGKNCEIRAGAYIRGGVLIGDDVKIGHATEIKHSILFNNSYAAHFNYLGDSILGYKAHMAAGAITANVRLDKAPVRVRDGENSIDTGLPKFGSLIGDGSEIGCNAVLNPGSILGKKSVVFPLVSWRGILGENEKGKSGRL